MSHIINADLFNDRRDYIIAKLRQKIEEFKAYDENERRIIGILSRRMNG